MLGCSDADKEGTTPNAQKPETKTGITAITGKGESKTGITAITGGGDSFTKEVVTWANGEDGLTYGGGQSGKQFEIPTELVIPSEVNGSPVTTLSDGIFFDARNLISVIIPDTVTSIGKRAFVDCTNLAKITFLGEPPTLDAEEANATFENTNATMYYVPGMPGWGTSFGGRDCQSIE